MGPYALSFIACNKHISGEALCQPGRQTFPANNSPTIVKNIDKTKSTYEDPTTVLLGNL